MADAVGVDGEVKGRVSCIRRWAVYGGGGGG